MNDKQAKELEQTILSIYSKNIEYFKIEHKNLYSKIENFENKNYFQYSLSFENNHDVNQKKQVNIFLIIKI